MMHAYFIETKRYVNSKKKLKPLYHMKRFTKQLIRVRVQMSKQNESTSTLDLELNRHGAWQR